MEIILIKLTVTPLLMLALSITARRWGNLVGGIVSGLPLTSGPISVYLAIEQGVNFAGHAAASTLSGLSAVLICYVSYVFASKYCNIFLTCAGSLCIFLLFSWVMLSIAGVFFSVIVSAVAIYVVLQMTVDTGEHKAGGCTPPFDLPARLMASTALMLAVTMFADKLGPEISGVLSPVPVIAWPLVIFAHVQGGRAEAVATIRGTAAGSVGLIAFFLIVSHFVQISRPLPVYLAAVSASIIFSSSFGICIGFCRLRFR